jgi:hypothetical protein
MNKKICYWNVSWGRHSLMSQALIFSMRRNGINDDFIAFSDRELVDCTNRKLDHGIKLDLSNYLFKFQYLKLLKDEPYDYFIFIDADSFFVKPPTMSPLELVKNQSPWHCFLESPINLKSTKRRDWWGVPTTELTKIYRDLGVESTEIRNMNAGFWICKKEFISTAYSLGMSCFYKFKSLGYRITEEIPMAYISNYMSPDNTVHFHEKYFDYWASDWTGKFTNILPTDTEWEYTSYMTDEKFIIKPSLVHAMRSKRALIEVGHKIHLYNNK